ncbi:MAG: immunoglobulin-like domain-containing protein [Ignavibacteriales bacterium]
MKKNAFTLIELLGVISILGLIVLIALPAVEKNIKNSKQKLYEAQISNIKSGLMNWVADNLIYLPSENGEMVTLTLYQLKQGGYIEKNILNPLNDELFPNDMFLTITKKSNSFQYAILTDTGTRTGTAVINPDAPVLIINGSPFQYVEIKNTYTDPGVTALDSEGNVIAASNVVTTIGGDGTSINTNVFGNYTVKYQVTDPDNGYKTAVIRTVAISDKTKPNLVVPGNITLTPANVLTFNARTDATATDNYDGDLTSQIEITGNLSVLPGTYYLTYKVTDSSGNVASGKRTIVVGNSYVNVPVLATGMTPIKWNGTSWVNTTSSDSNWYNYDSKKWANAKTADGSMWVWIPRFVYRISSGWHTNTAGTIDIQFTKNTNDNWNSSVIGSIDTGTTADASNNKWTNHPAFTFGTTELTGIWVAKFEASGTTSAVDVKPNVSSLRSITIGNMFIATLNMKTNSRYGWGTSGNDIDTHMAKNIEWGAATYLSQSIYGKNAAIWLNNSNTYITGCAGASETASSYAGCQYTYDTSNGQQASTTGNIYGIYDMSGGANEYVAAYINNGNASLTTYGNSIINADSKYKDIYTVGATDNWDNNYALAVNKKGDAIYETSSSGGASDVNSWYGTYSRTAYSTSPWFIRGGLYNINGSAGVFNFSYYNGNGGTYHSFRPILVSTPGVIPTSPDTTPPVITILGDNPVPFHVCQLNYIDAGATAIDNVDGDLTSQIQKVEDVYDTHTVTYTVTDKSGNVATAIRNINYFEEVCQ